MKLIFILSLIFNFISPRVIASEFKVGVSAVDITQYDFESRPLNPNKPHYKFGDPFYDTGVDQLFDFEEPGAFGPDGKPGIAGIDDDGDGVIDNCDRKRCKEYDPEKSDDIKDPNQDNFHFFKNFKGTEGDRKYQYLFLAGFNPKMPFAVIEPNRYAVGVHDPIWARAIAIQGTNGEIILLMSTDLPGLTWKHINPVRRKLEKKLLYTKRKYRHCIYSCSFSSRAFFDK